MIDVEINGHMKKFWLDTGAGLSVVASDVAKECDILPIGTRKGKAGTATSKRVDVQPAIIADLRIGEISIKNHPVMIINKKDLECKLLGLFTIVNIDGIIGWNAIQNMDIEIDYKNKGTTIKKPIKRAESNRNLFWLGCPVVILMSEEGVQLNFALDTGAGRTSVTKDVLKKIRVDRVYSKKKLVHSVGGFERRQSQIVSDVTLILNGYALHFKDVRTGGSGAVFIKLDGTLGSDIAKDGCIIVDYLNGRFELRLSENDAK